MPYTLPIQTNFTAGELSPRLFGRVDISKYFNGLSTCRNFIVHVHGGVRRRPGLHFAAEIKNSAKKARLIPFEFSDEQAYVIEAGESGGAGYFRFYKDSGRIEDPPGTPVEIATPYLEIDFPDLRWAQSADVLYIVHPDHEPRKLSRTSHTSWSLTTVDFVDGPYLEENLDKDKLLVPSAGTGTGVTLTAVGHSPFQAGHVGSLWRLKIGLTWGYVKVTGFTSSSEVTVDVKSDLGELVAQTSVATAQKLRPLTGSNERLAQGVLHGEKYQYAFVELSLKKTGTIAAGRKVWVEVWGDNNGAPNANDVRAVSEKKDADGISTTQGWVAFRFPAPASLDAAKRYHLVLQADYDKSDTNYLEWFGTTSDSYTGGTAQRNTSGTTWAAADNSILDFGFRQNSTYQWREGAWSDVRGWPREVTFHEQRLFFGANDAKPQTVWGSVTNDFENMTDSKPDGTVLDTHSVVATIAATKVNVIRWLLSTRVLLVGTLGGEHQIKGDTTKGLTPTTIRASGESTYGTNKAKPVRVDDIVLFCQRSGRKIRQFEYSFDSDAYKAQNLSLLAEHLLPNDSTNVVEMAWQSEPEPILWMIRMDGVLLGMTYDRVQEVIGWHRHDTDGAFESVAVIPHPDLDRDQPWFVVKRTINGQTKRYIEFLDDKGNPFADYEQLNTDSALTYDGVPATNFSGLDHLEGKTVQVVGDGAVYPPKTVTAGAITITPAASKVEIGLGYTSELVTLRPEAPLAGGGGTSQGRLKRWAEVVVRLYRTLGLKVFGERIPFRSTADPMGAPPPLFDGDRRKTNTGWDRDALITIEQDQPLPANILAIAGVLDVSP